MVFFQLNVTGLLFQSFRTASPNIFQLKKDVGAKLLIFVYQMFCGKTICKAQRKMSQGKFYWGRLSENLIRAATN